MARRYTLKNGQALILREAEPCDAERLLAYIEQVSGESENIAFGPGEFKMSVEDERQFLAACANSPTSLYLVAEIAGEIVGTLSFSAGKRPRTRHTGEFGTSVQRAYWRLGIGSCMLTELIAWARATGIVRKINLRVLVDNLPALHLYEKHGFTREGYITREVYLRGRFIDAYIMGLQLDPAQS